MKKIFKIFNNSNANLEEFDDSPLSNEQVNIIKARVSKKLSKRKSYKKKVIVAASISLLVLVSPILTNETVLANINNSILTSINKVIGKFKNDKSTILSKNKLSHEIVIYSAHNSETYDNGMSVIDVGKKLSIKLNEMKLDSTHINSREAEYEDSYDYSNALIQNNIENFNESFLIDIHRLEEYPENKVNSPDIEFLLVESNPYYEDCKELVEHLSKNIEETSDLKVNIKIYKTGYLNFNQDLSPKSITVNFGYKNYSEDHINKIIDTFTKSLNEVIN